MLVIGTESNTVEAVGLIYSASCWSPWDEAIFGDRDIWELEEYTTQGLWRRLEKMDIQEERENILTGKGWRPRLCVLWYLEGWSSLPVKVLQPKLVGMAKN